MKSVFAHRVDFFFLKTFSSETPVIYDVINFENEQ